MKTLTMKLHTLLCLLAVLCLATACSDDNEPMPDPIPEGEALAIPVHVTANYAGIVVTDVCAQGANIVVDWGDGQRETLHSTEDLTDFFHRYTQEGTYTIQVAKANLRQLVIGDAIGQLTKEELHIDGCPLLEQLRLSSQAELQRVTLSNCPRLDYCYMSDCDKLARADLSGVPSVTRLECSTCEQLSSLDLSALTQLTQLYLHRLPFTAIDLRHNKQLEDLTLGEMEALPTLDLSEQKALKHLYLSHLPLLNELDLSACESLNELSAFEMPMEQVDVSGCPALTTLRCIHCQLTTLDVSANEALRLFGCGHNQLTELDLSKNKNLVYFSCTDNSLTALDVSHCPNIRLIDCSGNRMERDALEELFDSLPDYASKSTATGRANQLPPAEQVPSIAIQGNPGAERCATQLFTKKGWREMEPSTED